MVTLGNGWRIGSKKEEQEYIQNVLFSTISIHCLKIMHREIMHTELVNACIHFLGGVFGVLFEIE